MTSGAVIQRAKITVGAVEYTVNDLSSAQQFRGKFQHNNDAIARMASALMAEGRNDLAAIVSPPAYSLFGSSFGPSIWTPTSQDSSELWGASSGTVVRPFVPPKSTGAPQATAPEKKQTAYKPRMEPSTAETSMPEDILSPTYRSVYEDLKARAFLGNIAEKDFAALEPPALFALEKMLEALGKEDYKLFEEYENDAALAQVATIRGLMKASKNTMKQMAGELAATTTAGMTIINQGGDANKGIHYAENYRTQYSRQWREEYRDGFTATPLLQRVGGMDWLLVNGKSASDALDAWLTGLTIAECYTSLLALQYKAIRDKVGKAKFDSFFGADGISFREENRLRINFSPANPLYKFYTNFKEDANQGAIGARTNLNAGDWVYFYNHPKYLLKHPGGAVQGENAIYMGNGKFQGFGMSDKTEDELLDWLVNIYNAPRDYSDYRVILLSYTDKTLVSGLYSYMLDATELTKLNNQTIKELYASVSAGVDPLFKETSFPNKVSKKNILDDPAYTIGNTTRKGGLTSPRKTLKVSAVQYINSQS